MATDSAIKSFMESVMPVAKLIEMKTGIPAPLMASIMSWETDAGANAGSKYNNYLGIKYVGQQYATGGKVADMYAGYKTQEDFANDVSRIVGINAYGYPSIIQAAKNNPQNYEGIVQAWNKSSWAEDDYNTKEILRRAAMVNRSAAGAVPLSSPFSFNFDSLSGMGQEQLLKYAFIGAGVLLLLRMVTEPEKGGGFND